MRFLMRIGVIVGMFLAAASICSAATTVKSSKSNSSERQLIYSATVMTAQQAASILTELDKIGRGTVVNEAALRGILKKHGVRVDSIKKLVMRKDGIIIVLTDPAELPQAIAVADEGALSDKGAKPGQSKVKKPDSYQK